MLHQSMWRGDTHSLSLYRSWAKEPSCEKAKSVIAEAKETRFAIQDRIWQRHQWESQSLEVRPEDVNMVLPRLAQPGEGKGHV